MCTPQTSVAASAALTRLAARWLQTLDTGALFGGGVASTVGNFSFGGGTLNRPIGFAVTHIPEPGTALLLALGITA
jgi:hypothetical protein